MARLPHAAKTLRRQVLERHPRSTVEAHGDPDGLGVFRTLRFSKSAGQWLAPLLEVIEDRRIVRSQVTDAGYLHVEFSPRPIADQRDDFPLEDAELVLSESKRPDGGEVPGSAPSGPPPSPPDA